MSTSSFVRARATLKLYQHVSLVILGSLGASYTTGAQADLPDLQPGQWYQIPNSRMDAVAPNPLPPGPSGVKSLMNDWSGGVFDTTRNRLIVWGGGSMAYSGNEVYAFDVLGNQTWARLTNPSTNVDCDELTGMYPDGLPCAGRSYDFVDFHPGSNSLIKLGSAASYQSPTANAGNVNLFSFNTNQWRKGASRPLPLMLTGASSAYDATRDVFWLHSAYNQAFAKYDPDADSGRGQWTSYSPSNVSINAVSAIDPIGDRMVTLDGRSNRVIVHHLDNPSAPGVTVATSGDKTLEDVQGAGFEWDPVLNKFVGWGGGTSVYTLDPAGWVWARVDAAVSNTTIPTLPNANGTFGRFRYIPTLNAYVVVNRTNEDVYVFKLTGGGTLPDPTTKDADFMARISGPGVFKYQGFDSVTAVNSRRSPDFYGSYDYVNYDSSQKASGTGSVEFIIPSNSKANSSGTWNTNFSDTENIRFGAGETFYVQWRQRFDRAMLDTLYTTTDGTFGGWKQIIIGEAYANSCTTLHIVVNNAYQRHLPQMYHSCELYQMFTEKTNDGYKIQNGIDKGASVTPVQDRFVLNRYEKGGRTELRPGSPAMGYYPDEWMTFQIRVSPGPLGTAVDPNFGRTMTGFTNSTVEMWVAREGQPSVKTHSHSGVVLRRNSGAVDNGEKYGRVWFLPYQTNKDVNDVHPVGRTWVDEMIISRNRIPDPK